jgi:hypothetical protein
MKNQWSKLNTFQLGKYGEYFAKMEFTKHGFDVYTAEVDDKGIDFVIRKDVNNYYDIQVKSFRNYSYIFMRKNIFQPRQNLLLAAVLFKDSEEPHIMLMSSLEWKRRSETWFVERNYLGKKSQPEYGVNVSKSNIENLKTLYSFETQIPQL